MENEVSVMDKKVLVSGVKPVYVVGLAASMLLAGILIGYGVYYAMDTTKNQGNGDLYPTTSVTPTPTTVAEVLPAGWVYSKSPLCPVFMPIPPKASPYVEVKMGKYWKLGTQQPMSADLITFFSGKSGNSSRVSVSFIEDDSATDAPIPNVSVECMEYSSTPSKSQLKAIVVKGTSDYIASRKSNTSEINTMVSVEEQTRWGKDVIDFTMNYKQTELGFDTTIKYSLVISGNMMNLVSTNTTNIDGAFVQQTQNDIYQKLKFE